MIKKTLILFILCGILTVVSLKVGVLNFSLFNMTAEEFSVFYNIRLPRTLLCWLLGPLLALSGAILQNITKNPLSSPDILGINAASSLAGILTLVYLPSIPYTILPLMAFAGGMIAFGFIFLLGRKMGPVTLAITGVAIHILFSSATSMVISMNSLQIQAALSWMTGSLWGKSWEHVKMAIGPTFIVLALAWAFSRNLNLHQFSDDIMKGLGSKPNFSRLLFFIVSVFSGSLVVGIMGPVGFVSLLSPQAARYWVGNDFKKVFPLAALIAVFWLLFSDILGREILRPIEIPVGIITSIIGVPFFFFILSRFRKGVVR